MNKTIIWIGGVFAILNLLIGLIISVYGVVNVTITTFIILLTTIILLGVNGSMVLKDGFKVSLDFIIPVIGLIQYLFALFMPNRIADNWCLIVIITLLAFEALILIGTIFISKKISS